VSRRRDFARGAAERWRPPPFRQPRTRRDRAIARGRRVLDLQAASIWRDLRVELSTAHGDALDVGAGAQPYRRLFPTDVRYRAIDIVQAHERFQYDIPDTTYFDGERWPVAPRSVDLVLATETLEHVPRPHEFLAEARRVLRPGGRLVLTVPFSARWHYVPHDYWRFTPSSLADLLHATGFADVTVYARGNEVTVACVKAMALIAVLTHGTDTSVARRLVALLFSPLVLSLATVAHLSLRGDGGDDCLGWTATATATLTAPASPRST
jgi:SAM-dependent methyltransferase